MKFKRACERRGGCTFLSWKSQQDIFFFCLTVFLLLRVLLFQKMPSRHKHSYRLYSVNKRQSQVRCTLGRLQLGSGTRAQLFRALFGLAVPAVPGVKKMTKV